MECRPIEEFNAEGWVQQFTASGARAREAVELYRSLGLEVKTIPINELDCDGCTLCFESENDDTVMIMTRDAQERAMKTCRPRTNDNQSGRVQKGSQAEPRTEKRRLR